MSRRTKKVRVNFFRVDPLLGGRKQFTGAYPSEHVLDQLSLLDLASGEYHVPYGLFDKQLFCLVHRDGPISLLGAYSKDMYAAIMTERKGEIREIELHDDEGIVSPSYIAFFPDSVAAVVRTSIQSPGSAKVANWLSCFSDFDCFFSPLEVKDVLHRLPKDGKEVQSVKLRALKSRIAAIKAHHTPVADALQAASEVSGASKVEVMLTTAGPGDERQQWWPNMASVLSDLAEILPEFDGASVRRKDDTNIDLKASFLSNSQTVRLNDRSRLQISDIAGAIVNAFEVEQKTIAAAIEQNPEHNHEGAWRP